MNQAALLIYGAGGHAKVIADLAQKLGKKIIGFVDDSNPKRAGEKFHGEPVFADVEAATRLQTSYNDLEVIIAVGDCNARHRIATALDRCGFRLATLVHPAAVVAADVKIGNGSVVIAGAIINPGSVIGDNVIINTAASVDHDCRIGNAVHIGPGARLGGKVSVGDATWIGIAATIKDDVSIGKSCVIGAGALVLKDVPDDIVSYGSPASPVRPNAK